MNLYKVKGKMAVEVNIIIEAEDEIAAVEAAKYMAPFAEPFVGQAPGDVGVRLATDIDDRCRYIQVEPDDFITYDDAIFIGPVLEKQYD